MKVPGFPAILGLILAGLSGAALFLTSQNVQSSERELKTLEAQMESKHEEIRVLKAEWDYLNRPDRLEKLAREKLGLVAQPPEARVDDPTKLVDIPVSAPLEESPVTKVIIQPQSASTPVSLSTGGQ